MTEARDHYVGEGGDGQDPKLPDPPDPEPEPDPDVAPEPNPVEDPNE